MWGGLSTQRIYYGSGSSHGLKLEQIIGKNGSTELVDAHYIYGNDGRLSQVRDNNATSYTAYNGNVAGLVDSTTGQWRARYEYGPFGEPIRGSGSIAATNPFRFSTKYTDNQSGLLYYGYRYYNPSIGRWLSRDPIEEGGGNNLYNFNLNNPLSGADLLGFKTIELEFNAFIHASKGVAASTWFGTSINPFLAANGLTKLTWIDEPGGTLWITSTSGRGPCGGSSKVKTVVSSFDSQQIGRLKPLGITESTTSGTSNRIRNNWLGFGSGFVLQSRPGLIVSHSITVKDINLCKSKITIEASGEYPFNVGGLWGALVPNIDYKVTYFLERDAIGWVVVLDGTHNLFPDYEGRVSQYWIYYWPAPGTGPDIWNLNGWTSFIAIAGGLHSERQ